MARGRGRICGSTHPFSCSPGGDDFWKEVDIRASFFFTFYFLLVQCACMLYVHVCTQTCTDMHMKARCLPLLLSDLSLNLKLTMKVWLAGQKTPRVCFSLPHGTGVTGVHSQDQVCNVGSVDLNFPEQYLIAPREERSGKSLGEH